VDEKLQYLVFQRLQADGALEHDWSVLVIAACSGAEELDELLKAPKQLKTSKAQPPPPPEIPLGAFLKSITIQGFRGVGPETTLDLNPGPGLTLIVGRNGSGKSSFAEAAEFLLTGNSKRWQGRAKVWKEGWRNLHHPHPAMIEVQLLVEGEGPVLVTTQWDASGELENASTSVRPKGKPPTDLGFLGWEQALVTYRPFLSYNELGSMLDENPSTLYDAIATVLGLQELVDAQKLLANARLARSKEFDTAKSGATVLLDRLTEVDDPRGSVVHDALASKAWDLDTIEKTITFGSGASDADIAVLRQAATLERPEPESVDNVCKQLESAADALDAVRATDAEKAWQVAELLKQALVYHETHHDADCPICGRSAALNNKWREDAAREMESLQREAAQATRAREQRQQALANAGSLCAAPPIVLEKANTIGIDGETLKLTWQKWCNEASGISEPRELAGYLRDNVENLASALDDFRRQASAELERREDAWRPIATQLAVWLPTARAALEGVERIKDLTAAEKWLKSATETIRNERFEPIAKNSIEIWNRLRQNSNVSLEEINLAGAGTHRRVALAVTVDGTEGAALSVMSQGELNSLALSLFLPRATLDESPFRFVIIDDPVQSMDPARVDGLARALEDAAATRQVVVLTHDDRLTDSVRRLGIEATVIAVTRRLKSAVELRLSAHPVKNHIDDAMALVKTDELTNEIRHRVVPAFCRSAVEATCHEVTRRRRLGAGTPHDEVEETLHNANRLTALMALALFDDADRGGEVMARLNKFGGWAGTVFKAINKGAHEGYPGDLYKMVQDTEQLCKQVVTLR
jgi:recombinational DNA repair ATPase RecF